MRNFILQEERKAFDDLVSVNKVLPNSDQSSIDESGAVANTPEEHKEIVISEYMIRDVLDALQQCTKSFQRKEEVNSLERKELELREKGLAFTQERLSWEKEKAEKELAWKKKQYIRDLVK
ncbi:hypothetical protein [Chlamydia sp.]|uniref:hypothetical protein n=1 Tax=Chlamydia sp. TaxID=35827 RepID=UPI0025BF4AFF|nr:hypothetical protein [Chlamydia sp.]